MNYCIIAAAGSGERMSKGLYADKNTSIPKQFRKIGSQPIIVYTVKTVIEVNRFDRIIVATNSEYRDFCKEILQEYGCLEENVSIIDGGKNRIDTFFCLIDSIIAEKHTGHVSDVVMFMDANRPFTPAFIYNRLLDLCDKYDIVVPAMSLVDGICCVNNEFILQIPDKSNLYTFQTPECFTLNSFLGILVDKGREWMSHYLGVAEIYLAYGIKPKVIENDRLSMKITYDIDILVAEQIYDNIIKNRGGLKNEI